MTRERLPNRRPQLTRTLTSNGQELKVSVGLDMRTGHPREVFVTGAKDGSEFAVILEDTSVVISVALQHGVTAQELAKSVARVPAGPVAPTDLARAEGPAQTAPASIIGAVLDMICEMETG